MKYFIDGEEKYIKGRIKIKDLTDKLTLNREEYLFLEDGELLSKDDWAEETSVIEIIPVISGG